MKKLKIGVEKLRSTGRWTDNLTPSEYDRTVTLKKGLKVAVVGTTTRGWVQKIEGENVTFLSDLDDVLTENVKHLRAVL